MDKYLQKNKNAIVKGYPKSEELYTLINEFSGISLICKHIYSNTRRYLEQIDCDKEDENLAYNKNDLYHDLLACAYLFISICGTSYHYYEDVLLACEDICTDCMAWELFHKLKADLERLYALAL